MKRPSIFLLVILFYGSHVTAQIPSKPKTLMESASRDIAMNRHSLLNPIRKKLPSGAGSEILHDSTYTYQWDIYTRNWKALDKVINLYDSLGNNKEKLHQRWDKEINAWVDFEKTVWTYDINSLLREVLYLYWDATSSAWLKSYRQGYYDLNYGKVIEEDGQYWTAKERSWTNDYRITRKFDERGNLTELMSVLWNPESRIWRNYARYFCSYNDKSYLEELRYQRWNISRWSDIDKYIYRYSEQGKVIELLNQGWYGAWTNKDKYSLLYDSNDNLLEYRYQDWDMLQQLWLDQYVEIYTYDGVGNPSNRLSQFVQGEEDNWINYRNDMYVCDDRGNKTQEITEYWDDTWVKTYKFLCEFDDYGNLTDSVAQYWEPYLEAWVNNFRSTLYYSSHQIITSADHIAVNNDMLAFPNPVHETVLFTYPGGRVIQLEIYDASGMLIESILDKDEDGQSEIQLTNYKSGIYFFNIIHSGTVVDSGKLVKE